MRLACFQGDVVFGDSEANVKRFNAVLIDARELQIDLVVFPEAFLTGYAASSAEEARAIAITAELLPWLQGMVDETKVSAVVGYASTDGDRVYNEAALLQPGRPAYLYRKTHLPELGVDVFATPGDHIDVVDTPFGRIGIGICFDLRYPECARTMAVMGANLLVLPTNWPTGADMSADHISLVRAAENRIFVATCNRVGSENGYDFIGKSKIIGPNGQILAAAGIEETLIMADVDLAEAREKRIQAPAGYFTDVLGCRRPDLYR